MSGVDHNRDDRCFDGCRLADDVQLVNCFAGDAWSATKIRKAGQLAKSRVTNKICQITFIKTGAAAQRVRDASLICKAEHEMPAAWWLMKKEGGALSAGRRFV